MPDESRKDIARTAPAHQARGRCGALAGAAPPADTGGAASGDFSPYLPTGRARVAAVLWRIAGSPVVNVPINFSDVAQGQATRAEAAAALLRLSEFHVTW